MKRGENAKARRVRIKETKAKQLKVKERNAQSYVSEVSKSLNKQKEELKMKVNNKFAWTQRKGKAFAESAAEYE